MKNPTTTGKTNGKRRRMLEDMSPTRTAELFTPPSSVESHKEKRLRKKRLMKSSSPAAAGTTDSKYYNNYEIIFFFFFYNKYVIKDISINVFVLFFIWWPFNFIFTDN